VSFPGLTSTSTMRRWRKPCRTFEDRVVSLCRPTPTLDCRVELTACCLVMLLHPYGLAGRCFDECLPVCLSTSPWVRVQHIAVITSACLLVGMCPLTCLRESTRVDSRLHVVFCVCYLYLWFGPLLTVQYIMYLWCLWMTSYFGIMGQVQILAWSLRCFRK